MSDNSGAVMIPLLAISSLFALRNCDTIFKGCKTSVSAVDNIHIPRTIETTGNYNPENTFNLDLRTFDLKKEGTPYVSPQYEVTEIKELQDSRRYKSSYRPSEVRQEDRASIDEEMAQLYSRWKKSKGSAIKEFLNRQFKELFVDKYDPIILTDKITVGQARDEFIGIERSIHTSSAVMLRKYLDRPLFFDRKPTQKEIDFLIKNKVPLIYKFDALDISNYIAFVKPRKIKHGLLASNKLKVNKSIYNGIDDNLASQLSDISDKYTSSIPDMKIMESKEQLESESKSAQLNKETLLVIFHNEDGKLFGQNLSALSDFNYLTCNSYNLDSQGNLSQSITYLSTDITLKSLEQIHVPGTMSLFDYYNLFGYHYSQISKTQKRNKTILIVGGASLTIGTPGIIMFTHSKDKNNKDNKNNGKNIRKNS